MVCLEPPYSNREFQAKEEVLGSAASSESLPWGG